MEKRRLRRLVRALLEYLSETLADEAVNPASDNVPGHAVDNATKIEDAPAMAAPAVVVGMDRTEFRSRRKAAGVTMAQAGALLGVTERTVWRWEHGTSKIDPWKAEAIRRMLVPGLWAKIRQQDEMSGDVQ